MKCNDTVCRSVGCLFWLLRFFRVFLHGSFDFPEVMLGQPQQNHFQKEQNCGQVLRWLYGLAVSAVLTEQDVGRGMGGIQSRPLKFFYCGGVSHKTKMTNSAPRESICSPSPAAE